MNRDRYAINRTGISLNYSDSIRYIMIYKNRLFYSIRSMTWLLCAPLSAKTPVPATPPSNHDKKSNVASSSEGRALIDALRAAKYNLTPAVKAAYFKLAKTTALKELTSMNKALPSDFMGWIDSDPLVCASVYGARQRASDVMVVLRSLELDLGKDAVRNRYTQLALATAIACVDEAKKANVVTRPVMKLVIPGDPRKAVLAKQKSMPVDINTHIVNFFKTHAPINDIILDGGIKNLPKLVYDSDGVARNSGSGFTAPKSLRPLTPADVLASSSLQAEFNSYMKSKLMRCKIDCGNRVIYPELCDAIDARGQTGKSILVAYKLFRDAFIAGGLLAERDPAATPAERCAYLIRNDAYRFPDSVDKVADANPTSDPDADPVLSSVPVKTGNPPRIWPRFPLSAPWPLLTMLAADNQPLREREDLWLRFRDKGELHTYGEYIGKIAQQYDFQSARRLCEFGFGYGSVQMMLKDGGVCGTMASIAVCTNIMLGIPSTPAAQPGHCALISYGFDAGTGAYDCHGDQYVTAGDEGTDPLCRFMIGDTDERRPMVYHQSNAWAVNAGFPSFLDTMIVHDIYRLLPLAERKKSGSALLRCAIESNPFNLCVIDAALSDTPAVSEVLEIVKTAEVGVAALSKKSGCPVDGLFLKIVRAKALASIGKTKNTGEADCSVAVGELRRRVAAETIVRKTK